jgi:hypothetical protein
MRQRDKAGKTRSHNASARNAPKAAIRSQPARGNETNVARLTRELQEALEQQTAMSEILGVISSSPTDLAPVFNAILANATRLCEGNLAALWRYDGKFLVGAAQYNASAACRWSRSARRIARSCGLMRGLALRARIAAAADLR